MAEIKTIAIDDIHVGERLREIDEDHAAVIAASIREIGLQSPVQVRSTPAQKPRGLARIICMEKSNSGLNPFRPCRCSPVSRTLDPKRAKRRRA